jgi:hypothetical protein
MKGTAQEEARDVNTGTLFCIETYIASAGTTCPIVDIAQRSKTPTWLVGVDFKPTEEAAHGVVRWRLVHLAQWIWEEFGLSVTRRPGGFEDLFFQRLVPKFCG